MPNIWHAVDYDNRLYFDRVNQLGEHDENNYYYVWRVSLLYP